MSKDTVRILCEFPCELPSSQLPTNADVLKAIYFEQESNKITKEAAINVVAQQISEIWQSAKIPIVSLRTIKQKLKKYFGNYYKLVVSDVSRNKNEEKKIVFRVRGIFLSSIFMKCFPTLDLTFFCGKHETTF